MHARVPHLQVARLQHQRHGRALSRLKAHRRKIAEQLWRLPRGGRVCLVGV
jgi:hypothetical protein